MVMTPAFPEPRARKADPSTSRDAAVDTAPRAPRHRVVAAQILARHPSGLTDFQLAEMTGLQQTSIGKRRGELMAAGLVEDTGLRRSAPSGSMATVWRLTEEGQRWATEQSESPALRLVDAPQAPEVHEEAHAAPSGGSEPRSPRTSKKRSIHPAQYSPYLIPVLADALRRSSSFVANPSDAPRGFLLDPCAGLGHRLAEIADLAGFRPVGVEIERGYFEAGATHPCVWNADSTKLDDLIPRPACVDAWVCSFTYPGGMNDDFKARDASKRNTYIHRLREHLGDDYELSENSTARHGIRKGSRSIARYCELHEKILDQVTRVLKPGGIAVVNVKDVYKAGELGFATALWFLEQLEARGYTLLSWRMIPAQGLREGSNREVRAEFEDVITLRLL